MKKKPYLSNEKALPEDPLSSEELSKIDRYWRATLYLCVGMIYLRDNPLLRKPLRMEHIKKRLLGHWGTDPGQSFAWVHLNRLIRKYGLNMIFISGPGHGAPASLANAYLEGTYSEIYPDKSEDEEGMGKFFKQFSFPGGIGSHCTPETPGSIHEGGELGYSLSHGFGAAFDHPDLIVSVVIGDGVHDIKMARNAGVQVCAFLRGLGEKETLLRLRPDFSYDGILELKTMFC